MKTSVIMLLLVSLLIVIPASFAEMTEYVVIGYDGPERTATCADPGYSGLDVEARMIGDEEKCVYTCNYKATDHHDLDIGVPNVPTGHTFNLDPGTSLSDTRIRDECCGGDESVCFQVDECYYHPEPSTCSNDVVEADFDCSCKIRFFDLDGNLERETELTSCELCEQFQETCTDDYEHTVVDGVVECREEASVEYDCSCPGEPVAPGEDIECSITSEGESVESFTHTADDSGSFTEEYEGQSVDCSYDVDDSSEDDEEIEKEGELSCRCNVASSDHFLCTIYEEIHWDDDVMRRSIDQKTIPFPDHHGDTVYETLTTDGGRSVECPMDVPYGCDISDDQKGDGVCYTGCRSWEDPDCDYGRYLGRGINALLQGFDLPTYQESWNELLEGNNILGAIYTGAQNIPFTPEWFTSQVCSANMDVDDETACELVGLDGDDCVEEGDQWDGSDIFSDEPAISIVARDTGDDASDYVVRWVVTGISDAEMQVFLTDIEDAQAFQDYDKLNSERAVIYPAQDGFGELNSALYEYNTSRTYNSVCILFDSNDPDVKDELMEEHLETTGEPFACRYIAD
ncbi:MAG: hypothetical protein ACLFNK_00695 [Candidatus Woesearchaeota archaeon]